MDPKKKEWIDGKQQKYFVSAEDIGWIVCTAGWVDMTLEPSTGWFNDRVAKRLPPGYRMILKEIDPLGYAIAYHDDQGVMRMPREVLEPWSR